jgi:hypothetical protein
VLTQREGLVDLAEQCGITVLETIPDNSPNDGLYFTYYGRHIILMKASLPDRQFVPILAEEMGHCVATYGVVVEQDNVGLIKSENYGRAWAIEFLLPIFKFTYASIVTGCKTVSDYAEALDFDEVFVSDAIKYYKRKGCWPRSFKAMYRRLLKPNAEEQVPCNVIAG